MRATLDNRGFWEHQAIMAHATYTISNAECRGFSRTDSKKRSAGEMLATHLMRGFATCEACPDATPHAVAYYISEGSCKGGVMLTMLLLAEAKGIQSS